MTVPSPPAGSTQSLQEIPVRTSWGSLAKQLQGQEGVKTSREASPALRVSDCLRRVPSSAHPPRKHLLMEL